MNNKNDILNAWITIEQLSEGSIKLNDDKYRIFDERVGTDFFTIWTDFLDNQKEILKNSKRRIDKSGIVLYFDVFEFQEIVNILREKYEIPATHEEINNDNKFTFALYFDDKLNFIPEKLFFTVSGYIRYKREFPEDFLKAEALLRDDLSRQFKEKEFNVLLIDLLRKYKVDIKNCRYGFVENLENGDVNLHSFFIEDLEKAKNIQTHNLDRYFKGFNGQRINLDSDARSNHFSSSTIQKILEPKCYPLGRFPSNSNYSLSLMQAIAVNLSLNDENTIRSVNGPPGTGKTTLLKDIFADLVVQQAVEICQLPETKLPGDLFYWKDWKLGVIPSQIADKNIVVASSNNGAVQNIVNELPQISEISEEFENKMFTTDYFAKIANSKLEGNWTKDEKSDKNKRELKSELHKVKNWGLFSLEGGKSTNISKLLLNIEFMEKFLDEEYESNIEVYDEFLTLQKELLEERNKIQEYSEQIKKIPNLKNQYDNQSHYYNQEKMKKKEKLTRKNQLLVQKSELLKERNIKNEGKLIKYEVEMQDTIELMSENQRNFDVIMSQRPSLLWLRKVFSKDKVQAYYNELQAANNRLNILADTRERIKKEKNETDQAIKMDTEKLMVVVNDQSEIEREYSRWKRTEELKIEKIHNELEQIMKLKTETVEIQEIDFSKNYRALQLESPWFSKEYREKQSELFMKALEVRKQFLYENKKHLSAARKIWEKQSENISKENGEQLLYESWQWINFSIPVISTTFASFGRMFKNLKENSIGNLFIDEAGQALPQASVGAIFRSKKVMVVGDPSQIKPVLSIDSNLLNLLGQNYQVDETYVSADASTQTLVDATSKYGFQKNEDEWIGIPLWVHRRSDYPMFTISNEISYNGLMVQGKPFESAQGKSKWFNVSGKATEKYVKEQSIFLKKKITEHLEEDPSLAEEIYVITPFKYVADRLAKDLECIGFTKRKEGKSINVGTVHTFQGKEAKIVYFVLGADSDSKGAAGWAVSEANMMNVAATRAKKEFNIIGDISLYKGLGSKVANTTIAVIEKYNRQ